MFITRKPTYDKQPVVDFRLLNTRILRRNTSIPLMKDVLSILGNSKCEVMSCIDIKDAYHSIPLTEKSKEYCGILPYFGSPKYCYQVLPMGIACAPQIWMDYITLILGELEDKAKYIAIMDDLLIHSTKAEHWLLIEQLLQSMVKNGLRLSPKKCQLFKTNLVYMGNEFVISQKNITVTPLRCTQLCNYMILDGLLFKITENNVGEMDTVLCIPYSKVHVLLDMYHSSAMHGHVGITKCYQTISQRFYCPNLAEQLRAYITGCHVCQLFKKGKKFDRPFQKRVNINVPAMTKISMDIKHMTASHGYSYILVLLCEVSNYMVAIPLHSTKTPHILQVLQKGYVAYFGPPTHIVCDQDPTFTSSLMETFTEQLNIKMIMVSPTNHKSLLAEHGIKSIHFAGEAFS